MIADEALSGADVSIRAELLNLLIDLQARSGPADLLITHDMLVARAFSHRIAVTYRGRIVEQGTTAEVLERPLHPYTQRLLAVVPSHDAPPLEYRTEAPQSAPGAGCGFHPRCPHASAPCREVEPALRELRAGHSAGCHYAGSIDQRRHRAPAQPQPYLNRGVEAC